MALTFHESGGLLRSEISLCLALLDVWNLLLVVQPLYPDIKGWCKTLLGEFHVRSWYVYIRKTGLRMYQSTAGKGNKGMCIFRLLVSDRWCKTLLGEFRVRAWYVCIRKTGLCQKRMYQSTAGRGILCTSRLSALEKVGLGILRQIYLCACIKYLG